MAALAVLAATAIPLLVVEVAYRLEITRLVAAALEERVWGLGDAGWE